LKIRRKEMTELSTFACEHCSCTSRGHFNVKIDTKKKEKQEKQRLDRDKNSTQVSESNQKIKEKLGKECDKHNSEWNGWKGRIFPWKVEIDYSYSSFSKKHLSELYQITGRIALIKEELGHTLDNRYIYLGHYPLNYIVCPVCRHRKYFY
jgi:hypothetical protein